MELQPHYQFHSKQLQHSVLQKWWVHLCWCLPSHLKSRAELREFQHQTDHQVHCQKLWYPGNHFILENVEEVQVMFLLLCIPDH